jgi:hypothetical protein
MEWNRRAQETGFRTILMLEYEATGNSVYMRQFNTRTHKHTHTHIYVCMCVCLFVSVLFRSHVWSRIPCLNIRDICTYPQEHLESPIIKHETTHC